MHERRVTQYKELVSGPAYRDGRRQARGWIKITNLAAARLLLTPAELIVFDQRGRDRRANNSGANTQPLGKRRKADAAPAGRMDTGPAP